MPQFRLRFNEAVAQPFEKINVTRSPYMFAKLTASLSAALLAVVTLSTGTSAASSAGTSAGSPTAAGPPGLKSLAAAAIPFTPPPGAIFNRPSGTSAEKHRIIDRIERAISSSRRGSTIRIATWAMDVPETTDRLIGAHRRGVNVRMILNHKADTAQLRRLQRVLGTNIAERSFAVKCRNGCRGSRPAAMHSKFYLFSKVGLASKVIMVSSANLAFGGVFKGWNDLFTVVGNNRLYDGFRDVFTQMRTSRPAKVPYRVVTTPSGKYQARFYPRPGDGTKRTDPVYRDLTRVRCNGARPGTGINGHTVIRVSMFYWSGGRGEYLARKLLALDNAGCIVKAIYGAPSPRVSAILRHRGKNDGIDVRDSRYDFNRDGAVDEWVHTKYMMVSGIFGTNRSASFVFTGSANWTRTSLRQSDEVTLRIRSKGTHANYLRNFRDAYNNGSRPTPYSN